MRQAGRYHSHYQALKRYDDFIELCKNPELAAETALGPIHDFNFDAAILFSDLLFPLEAMGMGLRYDPGPKLDFHVRYAGAMWRSCRAARSWRSSMQFQADAMRLTRARLRADKGADRLRRRPVHALCLCRRRLAREPRRRRARAHERRLRGLQREAARSARRQHGAAVRARARSAWRCSTRPPARSMPPPTASTWCRCWPMCWRASASCDATTPVIYYSRGTGPAYWDQLHGLALPVPRHRLAARHRRSADPLRRSLGHPGQCRSGVAAPAVRELERRLREYFGAREGAAGSAARAAGSAASATASCNGRPKPTCAASSTLQREIFG